MTHLSSEQIKDGMAQFYGTEGYSNIGTALLTDGTTWLAENANCYWLFQDTAIYLRGYEEKDDFCVVRLESDGKGGFVVTAGDGNDNWGVLFEGEFTDFPDDLMPFEFYASYSIEHGAWVFMLKSEY